MPLLKYLGVFLLSAAIAFGASSGAQLGGGPGTINQLEQWLVSGSTVRLASTTANIRVPSLTNCDTIDTNGLGVFTCGTDASGSGSSGLGTTTPWTPGFLAMVVDNATVQGVATTTVTATSPLAFSNPVVKIGGSNSVLSLSTAGDWTGTLDGLNASDFEQGLTAGDGLTRTVNDFDCDTADTNTFGCLTDTDWDTFNNKQASLGSGTAGQILAWLSGAPTWTATTTFSGGLTYSAGNVTADLGTSITVGELASADFGDWTCNGATCSLDTAYTPQTRTITVAGTSNQLTSSAGAQDLSANRTWTLSLPSHVIFPGNFFVNNSTTTNATTTAVDILDRLTFGGVSGTAWSDFCVSITGGAGLCDGSDASGAGGSAYEIATTSDIAISQVAYINKVSGLTTLASVATGTVSSANSALTVTGSRYVLGGALSLTVATTSNNMFSGTAGQVLAFINGGWFGTATTTYSSGLTYSAGNVTADLGTSIVVGELASADFGSWTCNGVTCTIDAGAVSNTMLANSTISGVALGSNLANLTATNSSLTFSTTYNGSAAATIGLNLANANVWTGLQTFTNASSTQFTVGNPGGGSNVGIYFTQDGDGALTIQGIGNNANESITYNYDDVANSVGVSSATGVLGFDWGTLNLSMGALTLATDLTVANGGTGASSLTDHGVLVGSGTSAIDALVVGTNGQLLVGSSAADPVFATANCAANLTCTLGAGTFQIDLDAALTALTGIVSTGLIDFGSAVLEISNGANPTADDVGELAHDTSDNMLILDDFVVAKATNRIWGVTVASTSPYMIGGTNLAVPDQADGYTMTSITCKTVSGTSVAIIITDGTNATESITCDSNGEADDGSIANAAVTAAEDMYIDFGTVTGTVDTVSISVYGQWTRE